MYSYRTNPDYPSVELSPEMIETAMRTGRRMRALAAREVLTAFIGWMGAVRDTLFHRAAAGRGRHADVAG